MMNADVATYNVISPLNTQPAGGSSGTNHPLSDLNPDTLKEGAGGPMPDR